LSTVLLLTDAPEPAADVLPSLGLLSHVIRTGPASATAANGGSGVDAILVDARRDLVQVRRLLRLLHGAEMSVPVLAVVTEGGWAAVTADWGADDVILYTASPGEVDARLRLAIGKLTPAASGEIRSGDLLIDESTYSVRLRGHALDLTFKEFELLKFLAQYPGRVFTRVRRSRRMAWVSRCITSPRWSIRASDCPARRARVCRQASGSAARVASSPASSPGALVNRSSGMGSGARNAHRLDSSAAAGSARSSRSAISWVAAASEYG
jgi:DNA-binding response OmpR family regulator